MARDPRACLADARGAAEAIASYTEGKTFDDYAADEMLQAAVERRFTIIGEALSQAAKLDPALADRLPDLARIVAFRNILVHGYALVDHDQVWSAIQTRLPDLRTALDALLAE